MVFQAQVCPNCGAPLRFVGTQCSFCKVPLAAVPAPGSSTTAGPPPAAPPAVGDPSAPFSMRVDDVFSIKKRGTVATGRIEAGTLRVGDALVIEGASGTHPTTCSAIEAFRKTMGSATVGDTVGLMLDVEKGQIAPGDRLRSR